MTPIEAYEVTLQKIEELKQFGIGVIITPYNLEKYTPEDKEKLIQKYNLPDRIPPDRWIRVQLIVNKEQSEKVFEVVNYLRLAGIGFDTGGGCGFRDWELDWSFSYNPNGNKESSRECEAMVEDFIKEHLE